MVMADRKIMVGTASWSDPGFVQYWYPPKMRPADRLAWYAQHFRMVEINSTFYSVPDPAMVRRWCENTPDDFVFNVKLHRLLSHHAAPAKFLPPGMQKKLHLGKNTRVPLTPQSEEEMMAAFEPSLQLLQAAGKLGLLLLQLSPAFSPRKHQLAELEHVLGLAGNYPVAVELRNRNWLEGERKEETLSFLRRQKVVFVNVDAPPDNHFTIMPPDLNVVTNPSATYLRLHGRDPEAYLKGKTVAARFNYDYSEEELAGVAVRSEKLAREADVVHVVFNNNARDYAPHAALRLRKALGQLVDAPPRAQELF